MKNIFKYVVVLVLGFWLVISTVLSYFHLKSFYRDIVRNQWERIYSVVESDPLEWKDNKLEFGDYFKNSLFTDRIDYLNSIFFQQVLIEKCGYLGISYPEHNHSETLARFDEIFQNWPLFLQEFSEQYIYKVIIVKGLTSSARTIKFDHCDAFVFLINEQALFEAPNDWITRVEESNFTYNDPKQNIQLTIEDSIDPALTLENILIHEIGHAIGVVDKATPDFGYELNLDNKFPFFSNAFDSEVYVEFKKRKWDDEVYGSLGYYKDNQKMTFEKFQEAYKNLEKTSFPTFYSTKNALEHFADSFYSYVHCIIQGKPYLMKIDDGSNHAIEIPNGITSERCKLEFEFMQKLIKERKGS